MPNNSNARREKDRKKQSKKKKADSPPFHKEDKTSTDSQTAALALFPLQERIKPTWIAALALFLLQERIKPAWSSSLSLVGTDRAANLSDPRYLESALLLEFQRSLTEDEKFDMNDKVQRANPGASSKKLVA